MLKYHRTLEINCYVAGAGAFGVFIRWLQDQLAFTDDGLAERSFFHVFVILYILAMAYVFLRFVDQERNRRRYLPEDFCEALANPGKFYTFLRWAAGAIICVGSLLLLSVSEIDDDVVLLRILAGIGFVFGLTYPWFLSQANKASLQHRSLMCLVSMIPVLMFSTWLIVSYKANSINSVVWSYAIEFMAIVAAMNAYFRMAGFCFDASNGWRCMFSAMFGCASCIMAIADDRYMGMQIMFLGSALMLLLCNWIMFYNLKKSAPVPKAHPDDGFDRLGGSHYAPPDDGFERL